MNRIKVNIFVGLAFTLSTVHSSSTEGNFVEVPCISLPSDPPECDFDSPYRTIDGTCNNKEYVTQGARNTQLLRFLDPKYYDSDGLDTPVGTPGINETDIFPSAQEVYDSPIFQTSRQNENNGKFTTIFMTFGQFLDHDLSMTENEHIEFHPTCTEESLAADFEHPKFPILRKQGDFEAGCTAFLRSIPYCQEEGSERTVRQFPNEITSYIDASNVYGSYQGLLDRLRGENGDLLVSEGDLLPIDSETQMDCGNEKGCFLAGDARVNENIGLVSMHTLWVRQHNIVADELREQNPNWDGDKVFNEARKINGAIFQKIVYYDYLPLIIGELPEYEGYGKSVDATIRLAFSSAAYRFGHSQVEHSWSFLTESFDKKTREDITLQENFFKTTTVFEQGIEPILFGMTTNSSEKIDTTFVEDLAEKLFVEPGTNGFDNVIARNIQRARDHGLPGYIYYKGLCENRNLSNEDPGNFSIFENTIEQSQIDEMKKIYKSIYHVDLYAGGMSEKQDDLPLGPTFGCILRKQFLSSRDGDRFYFENRKKKENPGAFTRRQIKEIKKMTLAKVLCNNLSGAEKMREDVFQKPNKKGKPKPKNCNKLKDINYKRFKESTGSDQERLEELEELEEELEDLKEEFQ